MDKMTVLDSNGLVPDDTLHKGTFKCHKTDENSTHFVVHVSPKVFELKTSIPLHPKPIQKCIGILKIPNVNRERCTTILSVFLLGSNPPKIYISL